MDYRNKWPEHVQRIDAKRMKKDLFIDQPVKKHIGRLEHISEFRLWKSMSNEDICQLDVTSLSFIDMYRRLGRNCCVLDHGPSESQFERTVSDFEYRNVDSVEERASENQCL